MCEAMCPEAVDGTLSEAERRIFERHVAGCASCSKELEEAQRGAAWLGMLKGHAPEPPAALLAKILAGTTGSPASRTVEASAPERPTMWSGQELGDSPVSSAPPLIPVRQAAPAWALSSVLRSTLRVFRIENGRAALQPRLAMTAAMAFVSIALTLNLTGVRLKNLRASSFTPSGMRRAVTDASASAARSFQNLRVVYQVESRVSELRGEGPLATSRVASFEEPQINEANANDREDQNSQDQNQPPVQSRPVLRH